MKQKKTQKCFLAETANIVKLIFEEVAQYVNSNCIEVPVLTPHLSVVCIVAFIGKLSSRNTLLLQIIFH